MSRRRARIAMVGVPVVSHVLPSLALIRELVARGHRVTYADDPSRITPPTRPVRPPGGEHRCVDSPRALRLLPNGGS